MRKLRVFKLGRKLVKICKWVCTPKNRRPTGYIRLNHPSSDDGRRKTKKSFSFWVDCLKKVFWSNSAGESGKLSGLSPIYHVDQKPFKSLDRCNDCDGFKGVPKGYLAVYVGQKDEQHRFLIPVIYFNHPLFGKLLREAEEVYGFQQSGGITIPCEVSDFKSVQMKIAGEKQVKPVRRMLCLR